MNQQLQVFKNKELGLNVRALKNEDNSISVNVEDIAKGYGFIQTKNKKEYVRWETINKYLNEFGFSQLVGKDDYIPESLFYRLGMKANNEVANKFQDWLAKDVIPTIRKTGQYSVANTISIDVKETLRTDINQLVEEKIKQIEGKCSEYYRPSSSQKYNISQYIKKRLGIRKANEEYELVKQRVLIKLDAKKWEDVDVETLKDSLNIIDESIRVIKADRPYEQRSMFDI